MRAETVNRQQPKREEYPLPQLGDFEHVLYGAKKLLHMFVSGQWSVVGG